MIVSTAGICLKNDDFAGCYQNITVLLFSLQYNKKIICTYTKEKNGVRKNNQQSQVDKDFGVKR